MNRPLLAVALLALGACGTNGTIADDSDTVEPLESGDQNVIVGEANWQSTTLLDPEGAAAQNAAAVGYLSIPAASARCTAWLISPSMVVTNNHCIGSAAEAEGARVSFNYIDGVKSWQRVWYDCSTFVRTWSELDMTVLECAERDGVLPGAAQGWLELADDDANWLERIYIVHQNCDYFRDEECSPTKKYSPGRVAMSRATEFAYTADTLGGSSGSPVFSAGSNKVVGLHHQGMGDGDANGRGLYNEGVRASKLKAALAEITLE